MATPPTAPREPDVVDRPYVRGKMNFTWNVASATSNPLDPSKTCPPLETREAKIWDACSTRGSLDLGGEGFVLLDHTSSVSHLRDIKQLDKCESAP
ncbi:hypothetical protein M0D69_41770 [Caballeronia sp. SEWSISQ10-4 2]|uniref:hypothetical protein n=1 Tax=Caballeronia sp. SEWSISQ10-4 2 TaxID=2937438 RepID=UPI0026543013|nr:hypothetical protein [Caballeronia sp. SEWSISQ10-4 2]MDN7184435.1 hypothetical protein [Caballeronia sp. SEWSISQ10-4 2]